MIVMEQGLWHSCDGSSVIIMGHGLWHGYDGDNTRTGIVAGL